MVKVNAVGMACPLPVIETRKALRTEDVVETTVDNKIATENLRKMAAELGYTYELKEESADRFVVTVTKTEGEQAVQVPSADKDRMNILSSSIRLPWVKVMNSWVRI